MKEALVGRSKQRVCLLDGHILGCTLSGQSLALLGVLDVYEVDLHLLRRLDTDDERGTLAGSNDLMWVVDGLQQKTESALKLLDDGLCKDGEINVRMLVVNVLGELCNRLSIGVGLELEAPGLQEGFQFFVVGDDTIVNNSKLPVGVRPRRQSQTSVVSFFLKRWSGESGAFLQKLKFFFFKKKKTDAALIQIDGVEYTHL